MPRWGRPSRGMPAAPGHLSSGVPHVTPQVPFSPSRPRHRLEAGRCRAPRSWAQQIRSTPRGAAHSGPGAGIRPEQRAEGHSKQRCPSRTGISRGKMSEGRRHLFPGCAERIGRASALREAVKPGQRAAGLRLGADMRPRLTAATAEAGGRAEAQQTRRDGRSQGGHRAPQERHTRARRGRGVKDAGAAGTREGGRWAEELSVPQFCCVCGCFP